MNNATAVESAPNHPASRFMMKRKLIESEHS